MEKYNFFDSTPEDIREYSSDEFADYLGKLISTGVYSFGTNLQVTCTGTDINAKVNMGYAWIQGYMYKVVDVPVVLSHTLPDTNFDRIDRIVIRLDKRMENRYIKAFVLTGTPSAMPSPPALSRDANIYELSLAQVRIIKGKSYIETVQITDERSNGSVCGISTALVQQSTLKILKKDQNYSGGYIELEGADLSPGKAWFDNYNHSFRLQAQNADGSQSSLLRGYANGALEWKNVNIVKYSPNLIQNCTGIYGLLGWSEIPISGKFSTLSRSGDNGGFCFAHSGAVAAGTYDCLDSDKIEIPESLDITLSCDMYSLGLTAGAIATEIHYLRADFSVISFDSIVCPNNVFWQRYRKITKTPVGTKYVKIRLAAGNGANSVTKGWKNAKLEYGTMETPINFTGDLSQLFQLANDGKTNIANAINNKGVSASSTDTFASLATKIGQIYTGKKWASGTITPANNTGTVNNLTFAPSLVYATYITGTYTYFSIMRNTGNAADKIMGIAIQSGGNGSLPAWMSGQFLSNGFTMQFGVNSAYNWIAVE